MENNKNAETKVEQEKLDSEPRLGKVQQEPSMQGPKMHTDYQK